MADEALQSNEGLTPESGAPAPAPAAPAAPTPPSAGNEPAPRAASDKGEKGPIPYDRFNAVNSELKAWKDLGFTPEQARQAVEAVRRAEEQVAEDQRRQREEFDRTPDGQRQAQRRQAFLGLLEEALGPERTHALMRSLENFQRIEADHEATRIADSRSIMSEVAKEEGIKFADKTDAKNFENVVAAYIQNDNRLNQLYFNPETRAQAVREACQIEANRINRILQAQGAADLKTAASRKTSTMRSTRGGSLATVTENVLGTSTNRAQRRAEQRAIAGSALDAVFAELGM